MSRTGVIALAALAAACAVPDIVTPESGEPFLYLVLDPDARLVPIREADRTQFAVLMTTLTPLVAECRAAERFEMRQVDGGAPFAWREGNPYNPCEPVVANESFDVWADANYLLPESVPGDSLGAIDLERGARYRIEIETGGRTIRGEAVIPEAFTVSVVADGIRRRLVWPRVGGAGGYAITFDVEPRPMFQTDTTILVPTGAHRTVVRAFDENLFRYLSDERVGRAGIVGAYGVFGAVSTVSRAF